jgi:multidrug efflux pump subunit AcrA (membrane-fusion protein)
LTLFGGLAATALGMPPSGIAQTGGDQTGMAVTTATAAKSCITDNLYATGTVVPKDEVLVRPDGEGWRITQILVEDGDRVTAGQALARLTRVGTDGITGTLAAPAAGLLLHGAARAGAIVSARADPPFRIIPGGEVELLLEVPAPRMSRLKLQQVAKMDIAGAGESSGPVIFISPDLNPATQQGKARVALGNDPKLRIGAFGKATIDMGQSCGITIPFSSVLYSSEGPVVQVVRNNRVETRRVTLGLQSADKAEIARGVNDGDMVVVRAGAFLRDGDPVRAIRQESATERR